MKFEPCEKCKSNGKYPDGFILINKDGNESLKECECHKKWELENTLETKYKYSGFDMRHFNYSPRSYVGTNSIGDRDRLINYVNTFSENEAVRKCMVYMYGENGCQKSTLASWVGKSLISKGYKVKYILMNDLVKLLMDAEDFNEEKKENAEFKIQKLNDADLLIIDESFDKSKVKLYKSGFMDSFIDTFTRERIQKLNKGILYISNVLPSKIEENGFSHSVQDFIEREILINKTLLKFTDNYVRESKIEFNGESLF